MKKSELILKPCPICKKSIEENIYQNHIENDHIINVYDNIYIGSYKNACDKEELERYNIKYIINCASECKNKFENQNIDYYNINIKDQPNENIKEHFNSLYLKIEQYTKENKGNILFHCFKGKSRSSTFVISYIMKKNKISTNEAFCIVKKRKKNILPNLGFMSQLREYEKECMNEDV